jgi:DNA-binding NarL/FixJ family response regulator
MRVLLADDQYRIRFALRALLSQQPELEIVGEAVEAHSALAQAEATQPDLVLLAWELPGLASLDLPRALRKVCPRAVIIVLSGHPEERAASLQAGADAFVSKIDPPTRLLAAIHQAASRTLATSMTACTKDGGRCE